MAEKSKQIKQLITHLFQKFGSEKILIKDHWDEDENAIGLCESSERFLVYVAVYEDKPNKFYLALESPSLDDSFPYTPAGEFDDLTLEEVEDKTASHLRLDMLNEGTKYK